MIHLGNTDRYQEEAGDLKSERTEMETGRGGERERKRQREYTTSVWRVQRVKKKNAQCAYYFAIIRQSTAGLYFFVGKYSMVTVLKTQVFEEKLF
jgi:hypothetical protein